MVGVGARSSGSGRDGRARDGSVDDGDDDDDGVMMMVVVVVVVTTGCGSVAQVYVMW